MAVRKAVAVWEGTLKEGNGKFDISIGEHPYNFSSRFEDGSGSNPEEMLGAAHAACFSMALSAALERAGFPVTSVETTANVTLEKTDAGMSISKIHLVTIGKVPNIDEATFMEHANGTKDGCIISRALSAVPMTLDATLVQD